MKNLHLIYSKYLLKILPVYSINIFNNDLYLNIPSSKLILIFNILKYHTTCQFKVLTDICGIDYLSKKKRFQVVYNLLSIQFNYRIFITIQLKDYQSLNSLCQIYQNANWFEREVWDMFGILFINHPDLRRILTDYGFENFPLRKDFPLSGYFEVFYDDKLKQIQYKPVNLAQEFRKYSFNNPWTIKKYK